MSSDDTRAGARLRLRFPRSARMRTRSDFERAYKRGKRARGAAVVVVAVENGLPYSRLGLSVGRAIWKDAVDRNRLRRVLREAFRLRRADIPAGLDLVLIPACPRARPELAAVGDEIVLLARRAAAALGREPRARN
jgi:ribonuclease P protein component